jgi:hypothetical protein
LKEEEKKTVTQAHSSIRRIQVESNHQPPKPQRVLSALTILSLWIHISFESLIIIYNQNLIFRNISPTTSPRKPKIFQTSI